jgi:fructose-bisphosphate aldolase class 1
MNLDGTHDTLVKKFKELAIQNTLENRIKFRELIITTPGLE